MKTNGTRYAKANELLRKAWKESIRARCEELKHEAEKINKRVTEIEELIAKLDAEEANDEEEDAE